MILMLDYDGVLHPSGVYRSAGEMTIDGMTIENGPPGATLFMWAGILEEALRLFPQVRIVLSTSWVNVFGYEKAKASLPPSLQEKVIGATYDHRLDGGIYPPWTYRHRYEQIARYANRNALTEWIAIDDNLHGLPNRLSHRVVATNGDRGLSEVERVTELIEKLSHLQSGKLS